jgi:hypothetical protein
MMMKTDMLNPKFCYLDVPQDGTVRTMQVIGGPNSDMVSDAGGPGSGTKKRLFRDTYRVRVFTELVGDVSILTPGIYPRVNQINIDLSVYRDCADLTSEALSESFGMMSTGMLSSWNTASR